MSNFDRDYKISNEQKLLQSYAYTADTILKVLGGIEKNILGITSSISVREERLILCKNICGELAKKGKQVILVDILIIPDNPYNENIISSRKFTEIDIINCPKEKLLEILNKYNQELVIVNIPPVSVMADALEYASVCKNVILFEKYLYSKYSEYEDEILLLKQANVNIHGVIGYN